MTSNIQAMADYIPAAWRAYQHLGEIQALQQQAMPHIQALMTLMPQAQALYQQVFPDAPVPSAPQPHPQPHPTPSPQPKPIGITVKQLQEMLNHYGANLKVDGIYGGDTKRAVEAFQRGHGLAVDGWAGSETLNQLFSKVASDAAKTKT